MAAVGGHPFLGWEKGAKVQQKLSDHDSVELDYRKG